MQLDRYIYTICIVHIDELSKSAQVIYVAAVRTCDAVPKDFIGRIQDITDYLSHLPETQVNRACCQKYFGSEKWKFYEK